MKSNFISVGNISDHIFARFLNSFGDWRKFGLDNKVNFINKKTNKILAHCIYDNTNCTKQVFISPEYISEFKR